MKDKKKDKIKEQILALIILISAAGREGATHLILASQEVSAATMPSWLKNNIPLTLAGWLNPGTSTIVVGDESATALPVTDITDDESNPVHGAGLFGQAGNMRRSQTLYTPLSMLRELKEIMPASKKEENDENKPKILIPKFKQSNTVVTLKAKWKDDV